MNTTRTYIGWLLLLIALLAWGATGLFAWTITSDETDRALRVQTTQETESKEAGATRLHAIAQDSAQKRTKLDTILRVDVVSIVDMIEAAGKAAGVRLSVSNAQPENAPPSQGAGGPKLIATGFVVEAQGKFSSLLHLAQLFETLPLPSKIGRIDIEHTSSVGPGATDVWYMNAYIRVLTASDISS